MAAIACLVFALVVGAGSIPSSCSGGGTCPGQGSAASKLVLLQKGSLHERRAAGAKLLEQTDGPGQLANLWHEVEGATTRQELAAVLAVLKTDERQAVAAELTASFLQTRAVRSSGDGPHAEAAVVPVVPAAAPAVQDASHGAAAAAPAAAAAAPAEAAAPAAAPVAPAVAPAEAAAAPAEATVAPADATAAPAEATPAEATAAPAEAVAATVQKISPFGKEDVSRELQRRAASSQDTLVDAIENAEVAEIKRAVFRSLTRLRAATIKEFDTIARLETQAIDSYNDEHHYVSENPLDHLSSSEPKVAEDKYTSFHG